jgi:hypothetical protein
MYMNQVLKECDIGQYQDSIKSFPKNLKNRSVKPLWIIKSGKNQYRMSGPLLEKNGLISEWEWDLKSGKSGFISSLSIINVLVVTFTSKSVLMNLVETKLGKKRNE